MVFKGFRLSSTLPSCTDLPTSTQIGELLRRGKAKKICKVQLETQQQLLSYCEKLYLPAPNTCQLIESNPDCPAALQLLKEDYFVTPQEAALYKVEGACFTGPQQLRWVLGLTKMPGKFVLHMDGKHKLHHGVWILITIGTHYLRNTGVISVELTHSFVPLVYLFCKQHETTGGVQKVLKTPEHR